MNAKQKSVLIVEDEKPLAHALELKLKNAGFTVTVARDGQECLSLLGKGGFDVVLLDLMLPVMDGFQVLAQLRNKPNRPIIFVLSNLGQLEDERRSLELGAKKFFVKSDTSLSVIVDEVSSLL